MNSIYDYEKEIFDSLNSKERKHIWIKKSRGIFDCKICGKLNGPGMPGICYDCLDKRESCLYCGKLKLKGDKCDKCNK